MLGVSSTTIKRWAAEGRLPYVRTAGGHRRFSRVDVERLLNKHAAAEDELGEAAATWVDWLRHEDVAFIRTQVERLIDEHDSWFAAADFLDQVSAHIRDRWADSEFSIVEQNIARAKLLQALIAVATEFRPADDSLSCLLAALADEPEPLSLVLTQLCLRSEGIDALWVGGEVPVADLVQHMRELKGEPQVLALATSRGQSDNIFLLKACNDIAEACRELGWELLVSGKGAWPGNLDYGHRFHTFTDLKAKVDTLARLN